MKFSKLMRLDRQPIQFFLILQIQDGGGSYLENSKNRNISATERPI